MAQRWRKRCLVTESKTQQTSGDASRPSACQLRLTSVPQAGAEPRPLTVSSCGRASLVGTRLVCLTEESPGRRQVWLVDQWDSVPDLNVPLNPE